eukprot:m.9468 g.9468  ORF g.9468 m.9468 type:complete len:531 (+) comp5456_c0_seq1:231-1823(+)
MVETWKIGVFFTAVVIYLVVVLYIYWRTSDSYKLRQKRKELGYKDKGICSGLLVCCALCIGPINRKRWETKHKYFRTEDYGEKDEDWLQVDKTASWYKLQRGDVGTIQSQPKPKRHSGVVAEKGSFARPMSPASPAVGSATSGGLSAAASTTIISAEDAESVAPGLVAASSRGAAPMPPTVATASGQPKGYSRPAKPAAPQEVRVARHGGQHKPLNAAEIRQIANTLQPTSLSREFKGIPRNVCDPATFPPSFGRFNRQQDLVPNAHTRVRIECPKGIDIRTEYINANIVRGADAGDIARFIVTQAPLCGMETNAVSTIEHFWTMIWNYQVPVVAVVSSLAIHICPRFWPLADEVAGLQFGPYTLRCTTSATVSGFTASTIALRCAGSHKEHTLTLYHLDWPEKGVPKGPGALISLARRVLVDMDKYPEPIVLVDSLGQGPAASLLMLLHTLPCLTKREPVDVAKTLSVLREDRGGLVSSLAEYQLVYKALAVFSVKVKGAKAPPKYQPTPQFDATRAKQKNAYARAMKM